MKLNYIPAKSIVSKSDHRGLPFEPNPFQIWCVLRKHFESERSINIHNFFAERLGGAVSEFFSIIGISNRAYTFFS